MRKNICLNFALAICSISTIFANDDFPKICPDIITKNQWGGRGANKIEYAIAPVEYVIIHHTVTPTCTDKLDCSELLTNIQNFHMDDLEFDDIAYNFLIGGDGKVYEGRGWHKVGAHTRKYNSRSLGIAFMGTFTNKLPTAEQLQITKDLIRCAAELGELNEDYNLYGARQVGATQSPGLMLYNEIQLWPHFTKRL